MIASVFDNGDQLIAGVIYIVNDTDDVIVIDRR